MLENGERDEREGTGGTVSADGEGGVEEDTLQASRIPAGSPASRAFAVSPFPHLEWHATREGCCRRCRAPHCPRTACRYCAPPPSRQRFNRPCGHGALGRFEFTRLQAPACRCPCRSDRVRCCAVTTQARADRFHRRSAEADDCCRHTGHWCPTTQLSQLKICFQCSGRVVDHAGPGSTAALHADQQRTQWLTSTPFPSAPASVRCFLVFLSIQ